MYFLDTSVMLASFLEGDKRHAECRAFLLRMRRENAACGAHSFAEFYSVLTRLPAPSRLRPDQALALLEDVEKRVTPIALTATEYSQEMRRLAQKGISGGQVYDALLIACARKNKSRHIYTLDVDHFRSVAPDLADRIVSP